MTIIAVVTQNIDLFPRRVSTMIRTNRKRIESLHVMMLGTNVDSINTSYT